jgi:hypothetical protein
MGPIIGALIRLSITDQCRYCERQNGDERWRKNGDAEMSTTAMRSAKSPRGCG